MIFNGCQWGVVNLDDALSKPQLKQPEHQVSFSLGTPQENAFGVIKDAGQLFLAKGETQLLNCDTLKMKGSHNRSNALAALALGECAGLDMNSMLETLQTFPGLEHRCQWVGEHEGVDFYNDSKGTNVGATLAALEGLGPEIKGHLVLMAGGVSKDADFNFLHDCVNRYVKTLVVYGQDQQQIAEALNDATQVISASSFEDAFNKACKCATSNDTVLLSPACASFDMFNSFEHRGETFVKLVEAL